MFDSGPPYSVGTHLPRECEFCSFVAAASFTEPGPTHGVLVVTSFWDPSVRKPIPLQR